MSNFSDVGNVGNVDKREEASFERNLRDENVITEKNGGKRNPSQPEQKCDNGPKIVRLPLPVRPVRPRAAGDQ